GARRGALDGRGGRRQLPWLGFGQEQVAGRELGEYAPITLRERTAHGRFVSLAMKLDAAEPCPIPAERARSGLVTPPVLERELVVRVLVVGGQRTRALARDAQGAVLDDENPARFSAASSRFALGPRCQMRVKTGQVTTIEDRRGPRLGRLGDGQQRQANA